MQSINYLENRNCVGGEIPENHFVKTLIYLQKDSITKIYNALKPFWKHLVLTLVMRSANKYVTFSKHLIRVKKINVSVNLMRI